ncbi:acyl-CoA dehydrogenase family protein [Mycolicibacterium sp. F2034L]|uniref:acyl-CoA dehydrogenase family protein n=1 Tax=Mycolicibacterium sp. F2034L TaxID=2926422 RepID=UPI001FF36090|nr:acyl-CoA dehydrogenase family protein [Mycolicibacterium sp. F2034L]MCK0174118.1 acyl-CoA dehydrogenase [Mycolicibacterium sp. F2034L]
MTARTTLHLTAPRPRYVERPLGGSVADRLARLPEIVADLRREDPEAERHRVLQHDAVRRLRAAGLLSLRVPIRYGGPGGRARDVLAVVIAIGQGSSNVAQALRAHYGYSERLLSNRAGEHERVRWFAAVNDGVVFGNAVTDAAGAAPSGADTTVLADERGVLRLNGHKFYSTGTLFADVVAVSAVDVEGRDVQVVIPTDRAGVDLYDDWDGFGQRTTASGGTRFSGVEVFPEEITTASTGRCLGHSTAFQQLYLAAVAAGIAHAVADDAVAYVRTTARPAAHSVTGSARTDPFVLQAVGEIAADAAAAEALVLNAADAIDALVDTERQHDPVALADVAVTVAKAQLVAERVTLSAAARLFDTGGASATARKRNLDRHWRNARTVASHSPLAYKAHATGDYLVNGAAPPASGYF